VTVVTARIIRRSYRGGMRRVLLLVLLPVILAGTPGPARAEGSWAWPLAGPVIRAFDPPDSPYGSGHRGIDIAAPVGTAVIAPADGIVSFAGPVGGRLFLTIDHGAGLESTYSWVSALRVRKGDRVTEGMPIADSGWGHPGSLVPHLHFGVRLDDVYVDPLLYLGPLSVSGFIRLAPLVAA
jgi:murein DD-endopeptidase MepM/ murein hydrolase activator NlpD